MGTSEPQDSGDGSRIPLLTRAIATGLFAGYIPWASGTFGSIVGLLIYLIPGVHNPLILVPLILVGFSAGVVTSAKVAAVEGNRLTTTAAAAKTLFQGGHHNAPDPSTVVIDEIVGMWVSLLLLPKTLPAVVLAFFLFRMFDVVKPPPASQLERIGNGWGIMLDDVVAGIFANIIAHIVLQIL